MAESLALPLGNWRTQEEGLARWWGSSISDTFTEHLCSTQLATRIRIPKLKTEVPVREIRKHEVIVLELEVVKIYLKEQEKNKS